MGLRYARSAVVRGTIVGLWLVAGCSGSGGSTNDVELCASDLDCDDGLFCNGAERCDPASPFAFRSGCALGPAVCLEGQSCDEANARCLDECPDADGDGAADIACGGTDCDDADGNRFPGNPEVCDEGGHDEDCDASTVGMRDRDGDGYTDMACCNGTVCGDDCADAIGAIHPNATETCDGLDQDCDAAIDEGQTQTAYLDADGDLHGDEDAEAMPSCPGWARTSTTRIDCDDANGAVHGAQLELCDGMDNDCDGETDEDVVALPWYADADGDGFGDPRGAVEVDCSQPSGFALLPLDCRDDDAAIRPTALEACNGRDDDCDGLANYVIAPGDLEDDDRDGHPDMACDGGTDCDDRDPFTGPGMPELCDGVDNDCDGTIDEGTDTATATWYADGDGDGIGGAVGVVAGCERPRGSFVTVGGDCNDDDPEVGPERLERCNGIDDDCDGEVDEGAPGVLRIYPDGDGDGFGTGEGRFACAIEAGHVTLPGDCDDEVASTHPGATEFCNVADDDCDDFVDEDAEPVNWFVDGDGDGHGDPLSAPMLSCTPIDGRAPNSDDCNDAAPDMNPGGVETCDGRNEDCDGATDEGLTVTYFRDVDGDDYGDDADTQDVCGGAAPSGYVATGGDCDDSDGSRNPDIPELCDGIDQDCDDATDEGAALAECVGAGFTGACAPGGGCACAGSLGDCNGNPVDGCESNAMDDPDHCGGCGAPCSTGDTCTGGTCDLSPIRELALVEEGVCYRRENGVIACAGQDAFLDLFLDPNDAVRLVPERHPIAGEFIAGVAYSAFGGSAGQHLCVIQDAGATIRCWGRGLSGELGDGGMTDPGEGETVVAQTPDGATYSKISVGEGFTCALRTTGEVDCWGSNTLGQLGTGDTDRRTTPTPVLGLDDAIDIDAGNAHVCVIRAGGTVACWGQNDQRLGDRGDSPSSLQAETLVDVSGAVGIAAGETHSCAVLNTGGVVCWGTDTYGQLGDGALGATRPEAVAVELITDATLVTAGGHTSCAILGDQRVACWGNNDNGQLGNDDQPNRNPLPQVVVDTLGQPIRATFVDTSERVFTCAVLTDDGVACWGRDDRNRFGTGAASSSSPVAVRMAGLPQ